MKTGDILPSCEIGITQELIDVYASISGDFNPIHVDAAAGAASMFGGTIAHGCIPMEPVFQSIQRWAGREILPSGSAIRLRYLAPARPGDVIRSEATVSEIRTVEGRAVAVIAFACVNQQGERVIAGECDLLS